MLASTDEACRRTKRHCKSSGSALWKSQEDLKFNLISLLSLQYNNLPYSNEKTGTPSTSNGTLCSLWSSFLLWKTRESVHWQTSRRLRLPKHRPYQPLSITLHVEPIDTGDDSLTRMGMVYPGRPKLRNGCEMNSWLSSGLERFFSCQQVFLIPPVHKLDSIDTCSSKRIHYYAQSYSLRFHDPGDREQCLYYRFSAQLFLVFFLMVTTNLLIRDMKHLEKKS
jgi:hypothetical protein